ncbi:MAG: hypothetical protein WA057_04065 [Candidatus Magasanikiibacteriota bacterium]
MNCKKCGVELNEENGCEQETCCKACCDCKEDESCCGDGGCGCNCQ